MTALTGQTLRANLKEQALLEEAMALAGWDQLTGMPQASGDFRAELKSYLASRYLAVATGEAAQELNKYFGQPTHLAELSTDDQALFKRFQSDYVRDASIPKAEYEAFQRLASQGQDAWTAARQADDYQLYAPVLAKLIQAKRQFIRYWRKDEATPYDVLLNQFEPGLTVDKLDRIFDQLKTGITDIRQQLKDYGVEPDASFLQRTVAVDKQRAYVWEAFSALGYDAQKGRLDDTIHPFMQDLNCNDARITTRWSPNDYQMAILGVYHEAGHGLFAQNIDPKWDYTPFNKGIAMSIHESQSLFNEVMIGRSKDFWTSEFPRLQAAWPAALGDIELEQFYRGWMKTAPTLIWTEADPLTYPLHIIIRYEIEKALFNDDLPVADLEKLWNDKYEAYLGVRPESALTGILQDIHWASGDFGYFPSYALGHLYAAQFLQAMEKELPVKALLQAGDLAPLIAWRREHVWQYGASKTPAEISQTATGESLQPSYWLKLQTERYADVYQL